MSAKSFFWIGLILMGIYFAVADGNWIILQGIGLFFLIAFVVFFIIAVIAEWYYKRKDKKSDDKVYDTTATRK